MVHVHHINFDNTQRARAHEYAKGVAGEARTMSPVHLRRIDAERNMRRFYELDVRPNLFGHWAFIREWGRIGSPGQVMTLLFPTFEEAHAALERQQRVKVGRGYIQTLRAREGS